MNLRKISVTAIAFLALALASCGSLRRAGKDLFVVGASPGIILYAGATDAYTTAHEVREGLGGGVVTEVVSAIPAFLYHSVKHTLYSFAHAVDFVFFPAYGLAELHPYGPEIEPLDFYTGTWFDASPEEGESGTDAESGESQDQ